MEKSDKDIQSLITAFNDFNEIIIRFQKTHEALQNKIELLNSQIESKNIELEKKFYEVEDIKNFLNNILENEYTAVIVIDTKGKITNYNRAAEQITGYSKQEVIGKHYKDLQINKKDADSRSALYTLSTQKESYHRQKNILTADKQEKSVEFSATLLKDHENKVLGVVETFNDISEIKLLKDRVRQVETLAALGEMSASVAHEIRNPLAGIIGFVGLLDRQILEDDPKKDLIKSIYSGTKKLNEIISNLLTLTRPQKLCLSKTNLYTFLHDTVEYFLTTIPLCDKEVKIDLDVDNNGCNIYIDTQLLQQVLINLIKNSVDSITTKGTIIIKTKSNIFEPISDVLEEEEKNELIQLFSDIEISISDNGCGMPDEVLEKIFNPFFTTKNDGNGLGLAICKKIIQLHKGDIHANSKVGKGTTFLINMPLFEQPN